MDGFSFLKLQEPKFFYLNISVREIKSEVEPCIKTKYFKILMITFDFIREMGE